MSLSAKVARMGLVVNQVQSRIVQRYQDNPGLLDSENPEETPGPPSPSYVTQGIATPSSSSGGGSSGSSGGGSRAISPPTTGGTPRTGQMAGRGAPATNQPGHPSSRAIRSRSNSPAAASPAFPLQPPLPQGQATGQAPPRPASARAPASPVPAVRATPDASRSYGPPPFAPSRTPCPPAPTSSGWQGGRGKEAWAGQGGDGREPATFKQPVQPGPVATGPLSYPRAPRGPVVAGPVPGAAPWPSNGGMGRAGGSGWQQPAQTEAKPAWGGLGLLQGLLGALSRSTPPYSPSPPRRWPVITTPLQQQAPRVLAYQRQQQQQQPVPNQSAPAFQQQQQQQQQQAWGPMSVERNPGDVLPQQMLP